MGERNVDYATALQQISTENAELAERAVAARPV
jgi:hypothetical protein